MAGSDATPSPLENAAEDAGSGVIEACSALGNETRLAILIALWEAIEPFPDGRWDPTGGHPLTVSDLQDRLGIEDTGKLEEHLAKLTGGFVERDADGYVLRPEGKNVVQNIVTNVGLADPDFEKSEVDLDCWLCGAPSAIIYRNGRIYHVCTQCEGGLSLGEDHPSGVLNAWRASASALHGRSPDAIFKATFTDL